MWRHGDVRIAAVDTIPMGSTRLPHCVLLEGGEAGHFHRIDGRGEAELLEYGGSRFLRVLAPTACLVHEEYRTITLPRGLYRVWEQRESAPVAVLAT